MDQPLKLVCLLALAIGAGACSSPTAPLSTLAPPSSGAGSTGTLVVLGNTLFSGVGQTAQFNATDAAGVPVTSGVTWRTQTAGVISVSAAGLVTATGPGVASVQAQTANALGSATVFVLPSGGGTSAPRALTSCQSLNGGNYVLNADLPAAGGACLSAAGTVAIQLDCQGHAVPGISLNAVGSVSIANCAITRPSGFANVTGVTVATSTFTAPLTVTGSSNVTVSDSSFAMSAFYVIQIIGSTGSRLVRDTITDSSVSASAAVLFQNGSNNQTTQCTITGAYDNRATYFGTDDGILDINEVGDTFQGNTIRNFFDTAVEGVDLVGNLTVADNTISNIGVTSFGSYWCTNWTNTVFRNNDVSTTPMLLFTDYDTGFGQCGPTSISGGFSGNQIVGNRLHPPTPNALNQVGSVEVPGGFLRATGAVPRLVVAMGGVVTNNLIQGNDFGTSDGPFVSPLSGFIDGGGNICGPLNPKLSNFVCTGHSSTSALIRR